jgi:hypothetical protein
MHSAVDGAQRPRPIRGGMGRVSTALRVVAIWAFEGYSRSISAFDSLQGFVERRRRLFVLTGAGCSTNSGIPDYRDADGNWKRQQPVTCQAFVGDQVTRRRYWARSMVGCRRFCRAVPNDVAPAGIGFTQPVVSPCAALFGQGRARRRSCRVRPGDVPPFGQRRAARAQCIPQGCV